MKKPLLFILLILLIFVISTVAVNANYSATYGEQDVREIGWHIGWTMILKGIGTFGGFLFLLLLLYWMIAKLFP